MAFTKPANLKRLDAIAEDIYNAVLSYKSGNITGEHSMGRCRTMFLEKEQGSKIVQYIKKIKKIFDPYNLFNPHAIFSNQKLTDNTKLPEVIWDKDYQAPCSNYGFCNTVCPVFAIERSETGPWGRKNMLTYFQNQEKLNKKEKKELEKIINHCLLCTSCSLRCPSGADVAKLVELNRQKHFSYFSLWSLVSVFLAKFPKGVVLFSNTMGKFGKLIFSKPARWVLEISSKLGSKILPISPIKSNRYLPDLAPSSLRKRYQK